MLSSVGAIVGSDGQVKRVVVTERWRLGFHVQQGESLYVVPDLLVEEPVEWNDIAWVIKQAEDHVRKIA